MTTSFLCMDSVRAHRVVAGERGCPEWQRHRGNGEGRERRGDSRCDGRGRQPCAHREIAGSRHRRSGPLHHRQPSTRHVRGHVHAARIQRVKREGIELTASFTATVNVEMRVGTLEETITVTGETSTVDVQNVIQQRVMTRDVWMRFPRERNRSWHSACSFPA